MKPESKRARTGWGWKPTLTVPTSTALALAVLVAVALASAWSARDGLIEARRYREATRAEIQRLKTALERARADLETEAQGRAALIQSFRDELARQAEAVIRDHYREQKLAAAATVESTGFTRQGIALRARVTADGQKPWHATVTFARRAGRWVVVSFTEER